MILIIIPHEIERRDLDPAESFVQSPQEPSPVLAEMGSRSKLGLPGISECYLANQKRNL